MQIRLYPDEDAMDSVWSGLSYRPLIHVSTACGSGWVVLQGTASLGWRFQHQRTKARLLEVGVRGHSDYQAALLHNDEGDAVR
jgi:hypothetical protein